MGCRTKFCIGGGCVPTETSVQAWVEAFGYQFSPSDPLESDYQQLIADAPPFILGNTFGREFKVIAEACMRTRSLLFCSKSPGDSGTTYSQAASSNILGVGTSTGLQVAQEVTNAVGSSLSAAVPFIGAGLSVLLSAFQHHAQAVAAQENALNSLCPSFTEFVRKVDTAFFAGQVDAGDAANAITQAALQFKSTVSALYKECNAFCWYDEIAMLIGAVSPRYYSATVRGTSIIAESAHTGAVVTNGAAAPVPATTNVQQANEGALAMASGLVAAPSQLLSGNFSLVILIVIGAIAFLIGGRRRA